MAGFIVPTWPVPYGRGAKAVEQVVIEEEFRAAGVARPGIMIGGWALPPVIMYGTAEQQERWIPPTLRGEISWCQLFSEPGAGSDLASLTTRATRVEGGWLVNGQKVWTSMARQADWGILLARTNPEAPKHDGISCFMIDMKATEGMEIRPLRELTGDAMFNEVFFNDAFVPDDSLVGQEHDGWRAGAHDARQRAGVHGERDELRFGTRADPQGDRSARARNRPARARRGRAGSSRPRTASRASASV